ncbi:MarR family winged helix-turn-helix transcriptional regulator [Phytoactinopolyspora mesophila]|uniref:MarR family transcriptional regulator n=1 Tax=Phytoactinopolyspora mesophila TaxID=2650750 RepID=A0A7K3M6T0_9ACTN|nr:MarR family winged helix-turn-helix transcriptional regulator [Phytoactinopolyspora mesophila]NDL59019.1 MarR family transcriptional regulator [Phytoactinopolyspora mesophila]
MTTATDRPDVTGLESDLGWALGRVFRSYVKMFDAILSDLPGGPRGYQVLAAAVHGAARSQLALAQHLGIDRTVMTYLLDDLTGAGLVERQPDPADRRARRIVVTSAGQELLERLRLQLSHAEEHLLAPLDEHQRHTLRTLLQQVAQHAQHLDPVANTCDVVEDIRSGR